MPTVTPYRYFLGILIGLIAVLPLIVTLFLKSPYYISSEFLAYRFGDSMTLKYGDRSSVRPVQGIPTAILSRLLLSLNPVIGPQAEITREDLDHYARSFALAAAVLILLLSVFVWLQLEAVDASLVSTFLLSPWYIGVASMALIVSPEYWLGEWLWLSGSLFYLAKRDMLYKQMNLGYTGVLLLGGWLAMGATIKISLLGITPIFAMCFLPARNAKRSLLYIFLFLVGFSASYLTILSIYMGSFIQGWDLLIFQLQFFRTPNHSAGYLGWIDALSHKPEVSMLIVFVIFAAISIASQNRHSGLRASRFFFVVIFVTLWIVAYIMMLARRPHDSTLTSLSISALFITSYLALIASAQRRLATLCCLVCVLTAVAVAAHFPGLNGLSAIVKTEYGDVNSADIFTADAARAATAIWYMPSNYWNAILLPQLLGYNGGLGLYPVRDRSGMLYYDGAVVFKKLWPNSFILGDSESELTKIRLALLRGATVYYTRPKLELSSVSDESLNRLTETVRGTNHVLVERDVLYNGRHWVFGHSEKRFKTP